MSTRHSTEVTNLKDILSDLIPAEQKKIAAFRFETEFYITTMMTLMLTMFLKMMIVMLLKSMMIDDETNCQLK